MASSSKLVELRELLVERYPPSIRPSSGYLPTGLERVDAAVGGGLPHGSTVEVIRRGGCGGLLLAKLALLADHGFAVVIPKVYHELEPAGTVLAYDTTRVDQGNVRKTTKTLASYDASPALDFLRSHPACISSLGVFGMCLGGHSAFRTAMNPKVQAGDSAAV